MKCQDLERMIYVYDELTAQEQHAVTMHTQGCPACRALLANVQHATALVQEIASAKPRPENYSKLTGTIMQAVAQKRRSTRLINSPLLRYAMVATSLALVVAFGTASFYADVAPRKQYPSAKTVTLNSASLAKTYYDAKTQRVQRSHYACVKSGECTTLIENLKKKLL
jgi:anti-sigma factor RsiW